MNLPTIAIREATLVVDRFIVSLHGRRKTQKLLEALSDGEAHSREALCQAVYDLPGEASLRMREARQASLAKLICRSRRILVEAFQGTNIADDLEWFSYADHHWKLVKSRRKDSVRIALGNIGSSREKFI